MNIKSFKETQEQVENEGKKYKPISDYKNNLVFKSLPYEDAETANDAALKEKEMLGTKLYLKMFMLKKL